MLVRTVHLVMRVRLAAGGGSLLLLLATACGSGGEDVPSPGTGRWQCEPALRTPAAVGPTGPPGDRTLAEAVRHHVEPPYDVDRQQRDVVLVTTFADDSLTGEYEFVRRGTPRGWSLATVEECR